MSEKRRIRHRCSSALVICVVLATRSSSAFQAPLGALPHERRAPRASSACEVHDAPSAKRGNWHRPGFCEEAENAPYAGKGWALLSEGGEGGGGEQVAEEQRREPLPAVTQRSQPRRYIEDGALVTDGGEEWTIDLCSKRLSLLHRKLRQVKDLLAKQARNPDSLDEWQLIKVDRKPDLQLEIAELEALRRNLRQKELALPPGPRGSPAPAKRGRIAPGPFAGGMMANGNSSGSSQQQPLGGRAEDGGGVGDVARYTADGLRLAEPRRPPVPPPTAVASGATAAALPSAVRPRGDGGGAPPPGAGVGAQVSDVSEEDGEHVDFDWQQGYEDVEEQVAALEQPPEAPSGGYPKRLAGLMSFCRVSDKETCEILVAMGRVTVNGAVAHDPGIKVDVLTDIIVANGVAVTLPAKIDNSDETRKPRADEGKRTGPIPKAEKNTWKAKTKYRWNMDDGLLATRTRHAANAKKKRGSGGGRGGGGGFADGGW